MRLALALLGVPGAAPPIAGAAGAARRAAVHVADLRFFCPPLIPDTTKAAEGRLSVFLPDDCPPAAVTANFLSRARDPELKGSVGEGPNHSNHSNHSNSFKIGFFV